MVELKSETMKENLAAYALAFPLNKKGNQVIQQQLQLLEYPPKVKMQNKIMVSMCAQL